METTRQAPARSTTWDTKAFEQAVIIGGGDQAAWKKESADSASPATKLQDLSLGGMDEDDAGATKNGNTQKPATWPFEEPCAWNGASNTRPTQKAQQINQEYFNADFVEHKEFDEPKVSNGKTAGVPVKVVAAAASSKDTTIRTSKEDDSDDDDDSSSSSSSSSSSDDADDSSSSESGASFGVDDEEDDDDDGADPIYAHNDDDMLQESPPKKRPDSKPTPNRHHNQQHKRAASTSSVNAVAPRMVQQQPVPPPQPQPQSSLPKDDAAISANSIRGSAAGYNSMLAWNKPDADESMDFDGASISDDSHQKSEQPRRGQRRRSTRSADDQVHDPQQQQQDVTSSATRLQRGSSKRNLVKDEGPQRRAPPSRTESNRNLVNAVGREDLSASCHGNLEHNRTRKRSSTRKDELASTIHGAGNSAAAAASRSQGPGSAGRRVARTKSFDGTELAGPRQDLGTTVHGSSQISRIRSGSKRQGSGSSRGGRQSSTGKQDPRRGVLKRAMSTRNVKPPEEYAQGLDTSSRHQPRASGRFRMQRGSSVRQVVPPEQQARPAVAAEEVARPRERRRQSSSSVSLPRRRDLLILLREKKKVTKTDLLDKENRRLLHFLVYEHKMGVPYAILLQHYQTEQASDERPIRKMDYPTLFIDAGI